MDENVAKVVCEVDLRFTSGNAVPVERASVRDHEWQTIRARLVELEAENERLNAAWDISFKQAMQNGQSAQVQRARAERAEADLEAANKAVDTYREMLVSIIKVVRERDDRELQAHIDATGITAHLSENSRG